MTPKEWVAGAVVVNLAWLCLYSVVGEQVSFGLVGWECTDDGYYGHPNLAQFGKEFRDTMRSQGFKAYFAGDYSACGSFWIRGDTVVYAVKGSPGRSDGVTVQVVRFETRPIWERPIW